MFRPLHNIRFLYNATLLVLAVFLTGFIFALNLNAPRSIAIGAVYSVVIFYSWLLPWKYIEIYMAALCTCLVLTAFVLSDQPAIITGTAGMNALIALIAIWVNTSLVAITRHSLRKLRHAEHSLEHQVKLRTLALNDKIIELDIQQNLLEKNRNKFQGLLESAPDAMVILTEQGHIQFINAQAEAIFGYSCEELIDRPVDILLPEYFNNIRLEQAVEYSSGKLPQTRSVMEYKGLYKSGQAFPTELSLSLMETVDGTLYSLAIRNIADRKEAETDYHKISERLSIATNAGKIGIWEYNFESKDIFWDAITYGHFGLEEGQRKDLDAYCKSVVHPDDLMHVYREMTKAIKEARDARFEVRLILPGHPVKFLMITGIFERNDSKRAERMIGTCLDITELKSAQIGLERNEKSFMGAFAYSSIGMSLVALNGRFLRVNNSICESLGYKAEELLELTFQDLTHPDDLAKDLNLLNETLRNQRDSYQIDKRYIHKNGKLVHVILTVTGVRDILGELSHFISQIIDITPRIEADRKMVKLIEVTKGQNESLMNFAHIVSHNLRSHASNLSMLTNFLQTEEAPLEREHIFNMLVNATESLHETVQHLNEVVQVKTNLGDNQKSVNLLQSMKMVKRTINALLNENKVVCRMHIPKDHFIRVVPAYLDSILLNLYTNAIKYRSPQRDLVLDISSEKQNGEIILKFRDNGQGIDLNRHRQSMFGMYKTFHKHKQARGIGLYITKNQIESMQGSIDVISEVDAGSTFILKFIGSNQPNNISHESEDPNQLYHR